MKEETEDKAQRKQISNEIKELNAKLRELPKIRALWDRGQPSPTFVYRRGDDMQPARLVDAGVPSVLTAAAPAIGVGWIYASADGSIRANTTAEADDAGTLYSSY